MDLEPKAWAAPHPPVGACLLLPGPQSASPSCQPGGTGDASFLHKPEHPSLARGAFYLP